MGEYISYIHKDLYRNHSKTKHYKSVYIWYGIHLLNVFSEPNWSAYPSGNDGIIEKHYGDVIMGTIASQITSLTIVYSTVYSDADQRKHQSSASLAFVRGIHRGPVNSPHKWPVARKCFHLMTSSWEFLLLSPRHIDVSMAHYLIIHSYIHISFLDICVWWCV